jgi:hypothetical protein
MSASSVNVDGWDGAIGSDIVGGRYPTELLAFVDKGGGHTELVHMFEQNAVVGGVEGDFEVREHDVDVFVVIFCVLHCHDDGGEGVVNVAEETEAVLLLVEDAVGFSTFRACIFD